MTPCITAISSRICASMTSCPPGAGFDGAAESLLSDRQRIQAIVVDRPGSKIRAPLSLAAAILFSIIGKTSRLRHQVSLYHLDGREELRVTSRSSRGVKLGWANET